MKRKHIIIVSLAVVFVMGVTVGLTANKVLAAKAEQDDSQTQITVERLDGTDEMPEYTLQNAEQTGSYAVSSEETANYSDEDLKYLADMDKKLEEKFGLNTKMPLHNYPFGAGFEFSLEYKKRIWEMLVYNAEECEVSMSSERVYGSGGYTIGNCMFISPPYEIIGNTHEYQYFLFYDLVNPAEHKMYRVDEEIAYILSADIFKEYYNYRN